MYNEIKVKKVLMDEFRSQRISHDLSLEEMAEILEITRGLILIWKTADICAKQKCLSIFCCFWIIPRN